MNEKIRQKNSNLREQKVDYLEKFIEQEVPFRLREILTIPEGKEFDDIAEDCIRTLLENTDIIFDYDAIDELLNRICDEHGVDPTYDEEVSE